MRIPQNVKDVMQVLIDNGYDAYLVGGAVRDFLLNREPKDYDLATNALPDVVEGLYHKSIPTGKEYGTITIMYNDEPYEITTYRLESDYDGRRPKAVKYAKTLREDLSRRDFTINAMAMDANGNIIDYFDGKKDIEAGIIRCVGSPFDRIKDDRLRALRAIRFASRYNFRCTLDLVGAIGQTSLDGISEERIREELNKIIVSNKPSKHFRFMERAGILKQIVPELDECVGFVQRNPNHDKDIYGHIMSVVDNVEPKLELRLAALFHDIGKPNTFSIDDNGIGHFYQHHKESAKMCREIMRRLKYSNKEIDFVSELVYNHMSKYEFLRPKSVKKFINRVGKDKIHDLFKLQLADITGSKPPFNFENVIALRIECEKILEAEEPMSVKDLAVNGYDMMELGYQGEEIGKKLNYLLELVLDKPELNTKKHLIELAN